MKERITNVRNPYFPKKRNGHKDHLKASFKTEPNWDIIKNYNPFLHDYSFELGIPAIYFEFYLSVHDLTFFSKRYAKQYFCGPQKLWRDVGYTMLEKGHLTEYFKPNELQGLQVHTFRDYVYKDYLKPMPARYALSSLMRKKSRTFLKKLNEINYRYKSQHGSNKLKNIL